jgi:L-ribulose-5-phosphate 3-epimerase
VNTISFMTANFVARQVNYHMTGGWSQGNDATDDYFRPIATFAERFDIYLADVRRMGFNAIDLWIPLLNPAWATDDHINQAARILQSHNMPVVSLAGGFGASPAEFEASCRLAKALNIPVLGGMTPLVMQDRPAVVGLLKEYDLKLGIENHPEKTPQELLDRIGTDGEGVIGTAVDTGWFGTHDYDAALALRELRDHLFHVHLKDVLAPGGHETCRYGRGCVPIEACVEALKEIGYTGAISVEHEPESFDPTEDCIACREMLEGWLAG